MLHLHLESAHHDLLATRRLSNLSFFEAFYQYCYMPKHTVGEQLLDVRRDKRERAAVDALGHDDDADEEDEDGDQEEDDDDDVEAEEGMALSPDEE